MLLTMKAIVLFLGFIVLISFSSCSGNGILDESSDISSMVDCGTEETCWGNSYISSDGLRYRKNFLTGKWEVYDRDSRIWKEIEGTPSGFGGGVLANREKVPAIGPPDNYEYQQYLSFRLPNNAGVTDYPVTLSGQHHNIIILEDSPIIWGPIAGEIRKKIDLLQDLTEKDRENLEKISFYFKGIKYNVLFKEVSHTIKSDDKVIEYFRRNMLPPIYYPQAFPDPQVFPYPQEAN